MKARSVLPALLAVLVATPALADTSKFKVFGGASYVSPLGDEEVDFGTVRDSVEATDQLGWTVGVEFRFTTLLGLELDYVNATNDIEIGGETFGDVSMEPVSATLNFHFIPTSIVDLYVGPTATYFIFGDVDFENLGELDTENEFAYGASVGLDIGLGGLFAITGGVRWLKVDLSAEDSVTDAEFSVDPLFARLGVALRF